MTENTKNRYEFGSLPISEETRKGLTQENINYIGAVGRMLSLQDDFIETTLGEQTKTVFAEISKQNKVIIKIQRLIFDIQEELKDHEARLKKLEIRVNKMFTEHRINHSIE
jgi:hypothetical protein